MIKANVLLFAHFADAAGVSRVELDLIELSTVRACAERLSAQYPNLQDLLKVGRAAVNGEFSSPERTLCDGDEIAFLPPVSGG